jgi:ABC-type sugar transport system ATPase subunit
VSVPGRSDVADPVAVSFEQVTQRYGETVALDALDLQVRAGELLVLVGPSGSGKSTALRILAGLERPVRGRVRIGGRDVTADAPHRRGIAMVFQDYALYPHLTAGENLAFGLRVRREPDGRIRAAVDRVAATLELDGLLDRYPEQLSGGQQQRIALARAMVREPAVYLMDEPLSNLDAQLRVTTRAEIVELQRRLGATTVYVTHDQAEAMTMGSRIAVLAAGRLQQVGSPQQVYDAPVNRFVARFLGSPAMNLVPGGGVLGGGAGTVVGIRPEDLAVEAGGRLTATVSVVESLGSETVLFANCGDGTRLAVRTGPRAPQRPGDTLCLRVDAERLHVFDADSGRRLDAAPSGGAA